MNASRPEPGYENGHPCSRGAECRSSHCINGVCCATQCKRDENEVCNIPFRQGTCTPLQVDPTECLPDPPECPDGRFCADGFCCDQPCENGRCDRAGFLGVCIPSVADGQPCFGDDTACASGYCSRSFVCCREACEAGFCDSEGICRPLLPHGNSCQDDGECQSAVCDVFDGICCNRRCDPDTEFCFNGTCGRFPGPPEPGATPTTTPTARLTPGGGGSGCSTVDGDSAGGTVTMVALLPLVLWITRGWQLSPVRRRRGQHVR